MEQVIYLLGQIHAVIDSNKVDGEILERFVAIKSELESWLGKMKELNMLSYEKGFFEQLIDLMEDIRKLPQDLLGIRPESEWLGLIPLCYAFSSINYSYTLNKTMQCPQMFNIRGPNYLRDKVKIKSDTPLFNLRCIQLLRVGHLENHVAQQPWVALPINRVNHEFLVLNYMVPGNPLVQVVMIYESSTEAYDALTPPVNLITGEPMPVLPPTGWRKSLQQFWRADQEYCDSRFKLIPSVAEGPWAIRMAVGTQPALTGRKLKQSYFRGAGYFEIDIDIQSSSVASRILSMVRDVGCKMLTVDLAVTIQGNEDEELPERILCQTRFANFDFQLAQPLV